MEELSGSGSDDSDQVTFLLFNIARGTFCTEMFDVGPLLPAKFHLDRYKVGFYVPQNWKNWNFANIIDPKGRVP